MSIVNIANGLFPGNSLPLVVVASAARAGSTHISMVRGVYEAWGTGDFLVCLTDGATDPPADQTTQFTQLPVYYVPARAAVQFRVENQAVNINGGSVIVTGIRLVQIGAGPVTVYVNMLQDLLR